MSYTLHCIFFHFQKEELNIDGKKQELKKEENNNTGATKKKREREENGLVIPLEPISCIRHTHRD
jgi:hypothetical protein